MTAKALVTGASSGIGAGCVQRLLDQGINVVAVTRRPELILHPAVAVALDLAKLDTLPEDCASISRDHPDIDSLVLCAGAGRFGALEQFSADQIRSMVDLNLTSQLLLLRHFVPLFKAARKGRIVMMGSEAALEGHRNGAVYCASKFAVRGLAQALREECSTAGVQVTVINPGMVATSFFDELNFAPGASSDNALDVTDVVDAIEMALTMRQGSVVDEINLSPLKTVVRSKEPGKTL